MNCIQATFVLKYPSHTVNTAHNRWKVITVYMEIKKSVSAYLASVYNSNVSL